MKAKHTFLLLFLFCKLSAVAQIPPYVPTSGLLGWWPFSGNTFDSSRTSHLYDFTNNGAMLAADRFGRANHAYAFDGLGSTRLYMRNNPLINNTNECSISFWFQRNNVSDTTWMMDIREPAGRPQQFGAEFQNDMAVTKFISYIHPTRLGFDIRDSLAIDTAQWYHLVMTFDGTFTKFYVNGNLVGTDTALIIPAGGEWFVGSHRNSQSSTFLKSFNGRIDDIGVWSRALTQAEISGLYGGQLPLSCDNPFPVNLLQDLIGYYPFCGNIRDYSGANNDFTNPTGVTYTTDRYNRSDNACFFNGSDSYAQFLEANTPLFNDSDFAISYWFQRNTNTSPQGSWMMEMRSISYPPVYKFEFQSTDSEFNFINWVGGPYNYANYKNTTYFTIDTATWYNAVLSCNNNFSSLYINDTLVDTLTISPGGPIVPNGGKWYLGCNSAFLGLSRKLAFNGKLDDICVWSRSLTRSEVTQIYGFNPAGIDIPHTLSTFSIYPNPAHDHLTIDLGSNFQPSAGVMIRMYTVTGQEVFTTEARQQLLPIQLPSALAAGCYFVTLSGMNGQPPQTKKLLVE